MHPTDVPAAIAEAVALANSHKVHHTACVDCGQQVPTIAVGDGDFSIPRCPANAGKLQNSHRVPREELEVAKKELREAPVEVVLTGVEIGRIFQALSQETRRVEGLVGRWFSQDEVDTIAVLRDRFAALSVQAGL